MFSPTNLVILICLWLLGSIISNKEKYLVPLFYIYPLNVDSVYYSRNGTHQLQGEIDHSLVISINNTAQDIESSDHLEGILNSLNFKSDILHFGKYSINRISFVFCLVIEYDYPELSSSIPFSEFYTNISNRYVNFGKIHSVIPSYVKTGYIDEYRNGSEFFFVMPVSDNHFLFSMTCILSILRFEPDASFAYVDIGIYSYLKSMAQNFKFI